MDFLSRNKKRIIIAIIFLIIIFVLDPILLFLLFLAYIILKDSKKLRLIGELSALLNTGYTISEALDILGIYQPNYRKKLTRISRDLESGSSFSQACERFKHLFPSRFCRVVREGERKGVLPQLLKSYLEYHNRRLSFKKIKSHMFWYPFSVFIIGCLIANMVLIKVIPTFARMFSDLGSTLPLMTRVTIKAGEIVASGYISLFLLLVVIIYLAKRIKTQRGFFNMTRDRLDLFMLAIFTRDILVKGNALNEALLSAAYMTGSKDYMRAAESISNKVKNGKSWLQALKEKNTLPRELTTAIASGSLTGDVPSALEHLIAGLQQNDDILIWRTAQRFKYSATLFNIIIWGWFVISVYLPIFKLPHLIPLIP